MKVRFLIDEDLLLDYAKELCRYNSATDVLRVGEVGAPAFSTLDPGILLYCEQAHLASGHHHYGIFKLRKGYSIGIYLAELQLIWDASEAEEWLIKAAGFRCNRGNHHPATGIRG